MLAVFRNNRRSGPADRRTLARDGSAQRRVSLQGSRTPVGPSTLVDSTFAELPALIPPGDLLVLNTSRVRHARLIGTRASGAPAEILLIHPRPDGSWVSMVKPGSALQPGKHVVLGPDASLEIIEILSDGNRVVRFHGMTAEDTIARYGQLPLPPYIVRAPNELDESRYQTVYAQQEGSVAAPTAGLHFTTAVLDKLTAAGVMVAGLDLQVGPGTFKPVDVAEPDQHVMHPERYEIPARLCALVKRARERGGHVWAVGTTVVRALESAAVADGTVRSGQAETGLMIRPGFRFRVVDRLLTNFHLPRSTLLMLVSAFAGYDLTQAAYRHAVACRYRFYSYGDAMVII
jgi:S-adenosylmethionine:tRNA ribosyltransferase-isomerase